MATETETDVGEVNVEMSNIVDSLQTAVKHSKLKPKISTFDRPIAINSETNGAQAISPVPLLAKPPTPSRSKSKSKSKSKTKTKTKTQKKNHNQLAKHIDISKKKSTGTVTGTGTGRSESPFVGLGGGFPDTQKSNKRINTFKIKQQEFSRSYYLEFSDNPEMSYSYFHSRIKDKLVWFQDIEKLLPPTIPGQFIYGLLNLIFPADLYYSFHRYEFENGFKTEHRMDDFFTSRRVLSIQEVVPGLFPSLLWYKIIKYEPTPYKSMCYYQYIRQNDASKYYKFPILFGYIHMILICVLVFTFCENIQENVQFFNIQFTNIEENMHLLFAPLSLVNIICYILLFINVIHILCIFIVWRITWFLHIKIYDYKKRIFLYLSRRRSKEIQFIESLYVGNKAKINKESQYRIFYQINPQSYLCYKRNGELFISLLKWLNIFEYEENLDFFVASKQSWCIITFALHKYFGLLIFELIIIFGVNIITLISVLLFFLSYWVHTVELYTTDHYNISSKSKLEFHKSTNSCTCAAFIKIIKILLWPGILIYITLSYCIYIIIFHTTYFPVIWLGVGPIWLIVYSVLTRGYRRIYIFNGLALFFLYFVSINWFVFRNLLWIKGYAYIFRYLAGVALILFLFCFHISLQLETHRAMWFPRLSRQYKMEEQHKFGLHINGAKLYTFAQYAATYFKKKINFRKHFRSKGFGDYYENNGFDQTWYDKWYMKLPIQVFYPAKPNYPFVTQSAAF